MEILGIIGIIVLCFFLFIGGGLLGWIIKGLGEVIGFLFKGWGSCMRIILWIIAFFFVLAVLVG